MLVLNGNTVRWIPAAKGEARYGHALLGRAVDFSSAALIVYDLGQIRSIELPTEAQLARYNSARKGHAEQMTEYYNNNSYTGD